MNFDKTTGQMGVAILNEGKHPRHNWPIKYAHVHISLLHSSLVAIYRQQWCILYSIVVLHVGMTDALSNLKLPECTKGG